MRKMFLAVLVLAVSVFVVNMGEASEKADISMWPSWNTLDDLFYAGNSIEPIADREWFRMTAAKNGKPGADLLVIDDDWHRVSDRFEAGNTYWVIEKAAVENWDGTRTQSIMSLIGLCAHEGKPEVTLNQKAVYVRLCLMGFKFNPGIATVRSTYPASSHETKMNGGWLVPNDQKLVDGKVKKTGRVSGRKNIGFVTVEMPYDSGLDLELPDVDVVRNFVLAYGGAATTKENDWWIYACEKDIDEVDSFGLIFVDVYTGRRVHKLHADQGYFMISAERFRNPILNDLPEAINTPSFYPCGPNDWGYTDRLVNMGLYKRPEPKYDEDGDEIWEPEEETDDEENDGYANEYKENDDGTFSFRMYVHSDVLVLPWGVQKVEGNNMANGDHRKIFDWKLDPDGDNDMTIRADSGEEIGLIRITAKEPEMLSFAGVEVELASDDEEDEDQPIKTDRSNLADETAANQESVTVSADTASTETTTDSPNELGCNGGWGFWALVMLYPLARKRFGW